MWANRSQKTSILLFYSFPHLLCQKTEWHPSLFTQSLFFKHRWDRFVLVAFYRRVTVSESLPSLFLKEWWSWANPSCRSLKKSDGSDWLEKSMIELPTLRRSLAASSLLLTPYNPHPTLLSGNLGLFIGTLYCIILPSAILVYSARTKQKQSYRERFDAKNSATF